MPETAYFTVAEATALLPKLREIFTRVLQLRTQLRSLYKELDASGHAPTQDSLDDLSGPPEVSRNRAKFRGLYETLAAELEAIQAMGVLVKDIDTGLCDFMGRREGRDVLLCWRLGEPAIEHWHDLDAGFSGRRPVTEAELVGFETKDERSDAKSS